MEQTIDFSTITACGECCVGCGKRAEGICKGCIEADGYVPEWAGSGRCKVHACARSHNVQFCGICSEFPCQQLTTIIHWNPDIVEHLSALAEKYHGQYRKDGKKDLKEILVKMGISGQADITAFQCEEDNEDYDVWKVTVDNKSYVLKKAGEQEISVYNTFLESAGHGVPRFYKSVKDQDSTFFLMEYIEGRNLRKCDRESLKAALDVLIYLQDMYWERRELQNVGYGFEASLSDRQNRGRYLQDKDLERAYETYLQLYTSVPRTLCHDDLLPFNVLVAQGKASLIDWEDAGILPYPTSLARLIAHGEEDDTAFFYMKEEDKTYAVEYFFEHLIKDKGIAYNDYRRTLDYFLLYEYCEWIMVGNKYGDTESERFKRYLAKAREHVFSRLA